MKLVKGVYKASNVSFDPRTPSATSYEWWRFVRPMGERLVFNAYPYSPTTQKHQQKVRRVMRSLGLNWIEIESPRSLDRPDALSEAVKHYQNQIDSLMEAIKNPRSRFETNEARRLKIRELEAMIDLCREIEYSM